MKKFIFNKLIRDNIASMMQKEGAIVHLKQSLSQEQVLDYYKAKLVEESKEVYAAKNRSEFIEELGDLLEVVQALCERAQITQDDIDKARQQKNQEKGAFQRGIIADFVEVDAAHPFAQYYLSAPDKYPEAV